MKSFSELVLLSTLAQIADGLSVSQQPQLQQQQQQQRQDAQLRVISLPIHRSEASLYYLNASLGTPPQNVRLHLDTGSSDLWVNTPKSSLCSKKQRCSESETYSANSSSTYHYIASTFNISYVDGSGSTGDYATDVLRFAGQTVSDLQFGIGYKSSSPQNVLGIGYPANEVQVLLNSENTYPNLPAKLRAQGLTSSNSYSLWLNDIESDEGSILFGGVDTSRFKGNLVGVPIQKIGDTYRQFTVTMTGLDVGSEAVASNAALGVLLDTGSSLTYLPDTITAEIYRLVNAVYLESEAAAVIPCSQENLTMTFRFSSPAAITVPLSELIFSLEDPSAKSGSSKDSGNDTCIFGIMPAGNSVPILGDTFLRSAYVVYDMDNNEIALANARYDATKSDVLEIKSGGLGAVPSFTRASNPVAATAGLLSTGGRGPSGRFPGSDSGASAGGREASSKSALKAMLVFAASLAAVC
ncbi:hypothetical protein E4U30_003961 [Claviceps sp. LM220 group G6]|nr:hypothetical protein E4U15_002448 [Claviceps sp. LM218 group G6]KAG6093867.1 hypothetical protein E4U30_003961 [Claviceps sp. LM220 group G6]